MSEIVGPSEVQIAVASYDRMLAETGRMLAETRKFSAEQNKLADEQSKLNAEARKLDAEARKLDRDRWLAPALAISGLIGGVLTVGLTLARAFRLIP